jgi:hypothetical protein
MVVVINPFSNSPFIIHNLGNGARQLVVHEALESRYGSLDRILFSLTPINYGYIFILRWAEMITFFAPPFVIWFSAPFTSLPFLLTPSFLIVNNP